MNCEPGDLAVVVSGFPLCNLGKIITVTRLIPCTGIDHQFWYYEGFLDRGDGTRILGVADDCLRPLRDNPGQDETLTWKSIPKEIA